MTPREKIDTLLAAAKEALAQAAALADEHGLEFAWEGPADSYGFGGRYEPAKNDWQASYGCEWEESDQNHPGEWVSSSQDC